MFWNLDWRTSPSRFDWTAWNLGALGYGQPILEWVALLIEMSPEPDNFYCDDIFNEDMEFLSDLKLFPLYDAPILTSLFVDYAIIILADYGAGA